MEQQDLTSGNPRVLAVHSSQTHSFTKAPQEAITLVAGIGVVGDVHSGATVKHRSRVAKDPAQPNLRQVHLIHSELFAELKAQGFIVLPGQLGENITTRDIDLLHLPTGTELRIGPEVVIRLTGLRNPCSQIDRFQPGLMAAVLGRDAEGGLVRKAGVMAIVVTGGVVNPGAAVQVTLPHEPHLALKPV